MPNYLAHECFGEAVRRRLPKGLKEAIAREPALFRSGLYGPDPLLFMPGGLYYSRFLHHNWQQLSAATLQEMTQRGTCEERSFAAGYLCHQILDDFCHPLIYRWMAEYGLSHHRLEWGLDRLLLGKVGKARVPALRAADRKRCAEVAAGVISPAGARLYRLGLAAMAAMCSQMTKLGRLRHGPLKAEYQAPVAQLQKVFLEATASAAMLISLFAAGETHPFGEETLPVAA